MDSTRVLSGALLVRRTTQTHTPCGSNLSRTLLKDTSTTSSSLVKSDPMTKVGIALTVSCRPGNWEESYQDLSPWCSKKPALCQLPAIDESPSSGSAEFQGEIDFDLRKSEEIASVPLEEDASFNWWSDKSPTQEKIYCEDASDPAVLSGSAALINDCWLNECEESQPFKGLATGRTSTLTSFSSEAVKHSAGESSVSPALSEEEGAQEKMDMITHSSLPDAVKIELQQSLERLARHLQPSASNKMKTTDLMKILQEQMALLNRKYRAPLVSDVHDKASCQSTESANSLNLDSSDDFFKLDPFEHLFAPPFGSQPAQSHQQLDATQITSNFGRQTSATHAVTESTLHPTSILSSSINGQDTHNSKVSDVFSNAHLEVLKNGGKQSLKLTQSNVTKQPALPSGDVFRRREKDLSLKLPPAHVMPEVDVNLDALLSEPSPNMGVKFEPSISTPEVLKPLVDTPDPESFDLLSYLCDDKVNTPPVSLEPNPFHFPLPSTSHSPSTVSNTDHKRNIMVVRPLGASEKAVVIEMKPQIMPAVKEEVVAPAPAPTPALASRPARSPRKRKYSEDYVFSPSSPAEDTTWSGRRKRASSSKDSDEEFTLPLRKPRRKSVISSFKKEEEDYDDDEEEEEEDEDVQVKRKESRSRADSRIRQGSRTISTSSEDKYRELRDRNNEASRKSRLTRKAREQELGRQAELLTKENRVLKVKVEEMEKLVKKLRESLLQSMMKKS